MQTSTRSAIRRMILTAASALVLFTTTSGAVVIRDDVSPEAYQQFANQFPAVGRIWAGRPDGLLELGSGTLIGTRWVLTAAHVVDGEKTSLSFKIGGISYVAQLSSILINPTYDGTNDYADIALFRLDVMPPIQPASIFDGPNELGQNIAMVGYGRTGVGSTGYNYKDPLGVIRAGTNTIDKSEFGRKWLSADFDAPPGYIYRGGNGSPFTNGTPTALEALHGGGDSGGGWFIQKNGVWSLAGVIEGTTSYASNGEGVYGEISTAVGVNAYTSWLKSAGVDFRFASAVPEPSIMALMAVAIILLIAPIRGAAYRACRRTGSRKSKVMKIQSIAAFLMTLLMAGCGQKTPHVSMEAMTLFGVPAALTFTNEGEQDIIITEVLINNQRPLTTVLRFGSPNRDFKATTLSQGEKISFDNPVMEPVNTVVICTDQGRKTFDLRE